LIGDADDSRHIRLCGQNTVGRFQLWLFSTQPSRQVKIRWMFHVEHGVRRAGESVKNLDDLKLALERINQRVRRHKLEP
jgi:hypothetical protein